MFSMKNVPGILKAMQDAQVPPRFTKEFLATLGFKSSNDRSVIGVLKSLGFLDQSGVPTDRYRGYRNKTEAPYILADAIREAYSDVFMANEHAENLPTERVKNIIATKVDKGDAVLDKMASTFRALVGAAKWDRGATAADKVVEEETPEPSSDPARNGHREEPVRERLPLQYAYNIQIQLPATKDVSVYNAIFRSIREHLL